MNVKTQGNNYEILYCCLIPFLKHYINIISLLHSFPALFL